MELRGAVRTFGVAALALALGGCGSSTAPTARDAAAVGPHGGAALELPGGVYGEVVFETPAGTAKGSKPVLAAYFLKEGMKEAADALPSAVTVKVLEPGGGSQEYTLTAAPNPKDPAGASRFASKPVKEVVDQLSGELTATVGGETKTVAFSGR